MISCDERWEASRARHRDERLFALMQSDSDSRLGPPRLRGREPASNLLRQGTMPRWHGSGMWRSFPSTLASICLVLALSWTDGLTPSAPAEPVAGSADNSSPMRFALFADGSPETCATTCRALIGASGMITADTARQFIAFVRDNALQAAQGGQAGATVVLESDGGSVLGALDLGRAIRRFGFATSVGRVVERRSATSTKYGEMNRRAHCQSMCSF